MFFINYMNYAQSNAAHEAFTTLSITQHTISELWTWRTCSSPGLTIWRILLLSMVWIKTPHYVAYCKQPWRSGLRSVCVFLCMRWFHHQCLQGSDHLSTIIDHCFAPSPRVNICHPRMPEICFGSGRAMRGQSDFNGKQQRWKWIIKLEVRKRVPCILMTAAKAHIILGISMCFWWDAGAFGDNFCSVCQTFWWISRTIHNSNYPHLPDNRKCTLNNTTSIAFVHIHTCSQYVLMKLFCTLFFPFLAQQNMHKS